MSSWIPKKPFIEDRLGALQLKILNLSVNAGIGRTYHNSFVYSVRNVLMLEVIKKSD
jgi:hypothetical protein